MIYALAIITMPEQHQAIILYELPAEMWKLDGAWRNGSQVLIQLESLTHLHFHWVG